MLDLDAVPTSSAYTERVWKDAYSLTNTWILYSYNFKCLLKDIEAAQFTELYLKTLMLDQKSLETHVKTIKCI